jgi:hypothetical protein
MLAATCRRWCREFILAGISRELHRSSKRLFLDRSSVAVFFAAVAICFMSAAMRDRLNRLPFAEEAIIAGHLIHGDGFLSPYDASPKAPPTCYSVPIYPLIIAGAYRVVGASHAVLALLTINSLSFGVIVAGVFRLGRFYVSSLAGWLSALFLVVHPVLLYFVTDWWDSYVALAIFVGLIVAVAQTPPRRWPGYALIGATMGVLSLTNPSYALSYPLLILIALRPQNWRQRFSGSTVCLAGFIVVLTPWTIRNALVFDRFIPLRGGTGYYLWLGNQPSATGWLEGDMLLAGPAVNEAERALILSLGEPKYFDLCDARMKQEYRDAPGEFWLRSAKRFCFVFMSDPTKAYLPIPMMNDFRWKQIYVDRAALHGAVMLLGFAGLWTAWRLRLKCLWIFGAGVLAEIPFVFTFGSDRYNLPMRVILLFFAGILFACLIHRIRRGVWPAPKDHGDPTKSSSPI